jgi:phosphatidylglycerol---prolipoprotein diacylglyceryl transferase
MPYPYTSFLGFTINTYTLHLAVGIIVSFALVMFIHQYEFPLHKVADVCLATLLVGLLVARVEHVIVHWSYFSEHTDEILRFTSGGLNWHGAVIGGLGGAWLISKWRGIPLAALLDSFALTLPFIAFGAWRGCEAVACAYGREVQTLASYPDFVVWEGADIYGLIYPRFHTQYLGQILALSLLLIILFLRWRQLLIGYHFALTLALLSIGMLGIGFLRGDAVPTLAEIRLDAFLHLFTLFFGVIFTHIINLRHRKRDYDRQKIRNES